MSAIPLEGRTRLPAKLQDAVQDSGLIASHILSASRSNELLGTAIKNTMGWDTAIQHTHTTLNKLALVEQAMDAQRVAIERSVEVISDVQEQLQTMESRRFYTAPPCHIIEHHEQ